MKKLLFFICLLTLLGCGVSRTDYYILEKKKKQLEIDYEYLQLKYNKLKREQAIATQEKKRENKVPSSPPSKTKSQPKYTTKDSPTRNSNTKSSYTSKGVPTPTQKSNTKSSTTRKSSSITKSSTKSSNISKGAPSTKPNTTKRSTITRTTKPKINPDFITKENINTPPTTTKSSRSTSTKRSSKPKINPDFLPQSNTKKTSKNTEVLATVLYNDVVVDLISCTQFGELIICDFVYTSKINDNRFQVYPLSKGIRIIDVKGKTYKFTNISIGDSRYSYHLMKNEPIKGKITFGGVKEKLNIIKLLKVMTGEQVGMEYQFKNIPVSQM